MNILKGVFNKKIMKEEFNAEVDDDDEEEIEENEIDALNPHLLHWSNSGSSYAPYPGTNITPEHMAHLIDQRQSAGEEYNRNYDILRGAGVDLTQVPLDLPGSGSSYNPYPVFYATDHTNDVKLPFGGTVSDELVDKLWEKMYQQPVLVRCPHCDSANVITNPTCIQCGAPLGKAETIHGKS